MAAVFRTVRLETIVSLPKNFVIPAKAGTHLLRAPSVPLPWIEALVAMNRDIIACERRFHDQCASIVERTAEGRDTAQNELLLASYMASLTLIRARRDSLLAEVSTDA